MAAAMVNAIPTANTNLAGVWFVRNIKSLEGQTTVTAPIERKRFSGTLANRSRLIPQVHRRNRIVRRLQEGATHV